jgi:hypothetical protein
MWTIPGVPNKYHAQLAIFIIPVVLGYINCARAKLDGTVKNGIVTFKSNIKLPMAAYMSTGLRDMLTPEERFPVFLHEVGHWVNWGGPAISVFFDVMFRISRTLFPPAAGILYVLGNLFGAHGEEKADLFVKKLGYGKQLAKSLEKISYQRRDVESVWTKILDAMRIFTMTIMDVLGPLSRVLTGYPSTQTRMKYLKDDIDFVLEDEVLLEEGIMSEKVLPLLIPPLREFTLKLDGILKNNLHDVFPFMK